MFGFRRSSLHGVNAQLEQLLDGALGSGAHETIVGTCDRCPANALVRVRLPSGSVLMLCGHHGRRYAPALLVQGALLTGELALVAPSGQPVRVGAA